MLFIADNSILIPDILFWGRICVKQAVVHQNQNILPKSYKKGLRHKRTDNYSSKNIKSSECNWWWAELLFQIKKSNFIFNMFRESYSSANILIVFLHLNFTGTFYTQNTLKTRWFVSIGYALWNILNKLKINYNERDVRLVAEILEKAKPYFSLQHFVHINIFDTRTQTKSFKRF